MVKTIYLIIFPILLILINFRAIAQFAAIRLHALVVDLNIIYKIILALVNVEQLSIIQLKIKLVILAPLIVQIALLVMSVIVARLDL